MSKKNLSSELSSDPIFYVYALIDPFTRKPFYIGKGKRDRIYIHVKRIEKGHYSNNKHKDNKIKKILSQGGKVIHKKLKENLIESEAFRLEEKFIRYFGLENLTNLTYGGEGNVPGEEIRKKISISRKGKCKGKDHPLYGKTHTKEYIEKYLSGKNNPFYGKTHNEEVKKKISKLHKGRKLSEEHIRKITLKNQGKNNPNYGNYWTEEQKENMRIKMGGKNHWRSKPVLVLKLRSNKILYRFGYIKEIKKIFGCKIYRKIYTGLKKKKEFLFRNKYRFIYEVKNEKT